MSSDGEKCNFCNRLRNNLNKVNWKRHLTKCELSFVIKKEKVSKNDRLGDIKAYFSNKRQKIENSDYEKDLQISSVNEFLPTDTASAGNYRNYLPSINFSVYCHQIWGKRKGGSF